MPTFSRDGAIWTLSLGDDENRFSPQFLDEVHAGLDELEASEGPAALVTTGEGKFFSNGLDLEWLGANPDQLGAYVERIHGMFSRVLTLPVPTVAVVNGHAFGGGAMLAIAHDYRVMRTDRGFWCFPEVDIQIPFTIGMDALITSKLTPRQASISMTTGRRYAGPDATEAGLVDAHAPLEELAEQAEGFVRDLAAKDRKTLGVIKQRLYANAVAALATTD